MKATMMLMNLAIAFGFCSCTTHSQFSGTPMRLDEALIAVGQAIRAADQQTQGRKSTGLVPAEVVVGFNVTNASKDEGTLSLNVVPAPSTTLTGGWTGGRTSQVGSTITVKYSSILLASKDSIVGSRSPQDTNELVNAVEQENATLKKVIVQKNQQIQDMEAKIKSFQSRQ
jgi:hypothetical protein